jgi:hypothetical protein
MPVNPNSHQCAGEMNKVIPSSIAIKLIELRKNNPIIVSGEFKLLLERILFLLMKGTADETWIIVAISALQSRKCPYWMTRIYAQSYRWRQKLSIG